MRRGAIHLGTSGYAYAHWRGLLFDASLATSRWLPRYAEVFSTLEVNATFYRLQTAETFARWRRETPRDFRFVCKGSRFLTHMKRLLDPQEGLKRFFEPMRALGDKLEAVLWQLPPQMNRVDLDRLARFLDAQPKGLKTAIEVRSDAWYRDDVFELLDAHGVAFCEHDLLGTSPRPTGGWRYLRFHGTSARYHGRYGAAGLRAAAKSLVAWRAKGREAFVFFNNDTHGDALYDARDLAALLGAPISLSLPR